MTDLASLLGSIDIYLFDQILRGRVPAGSAVFDAGCGPGRNLVYFLREGYDVRAVDPDAGAVRGVQALARALAPRLEESNFRAEPVEANSFPDSSADFVISSAVLHFARDAAHFRAMLDGTWRLVRSGGILFCRLASTIGMEGRFAPLGNGRFRVPDGSERYLVDEETLMALAGELSGELLDPLKTTVVQARRCMTTWVMKRAL
ncbi:MAG: class I SAM-dependent methyltransferase [Thermoanaerobaculia bacterium]